MRTMLAVRACKLTRGILHLTGKGGTSLPGKIAMAIDPDVLGRVSRGMHVILVTGTNGKTTTCRMLQNALDSDKKSCLLNRSGANLLSGITAEFVCNTDRKGRPLAGYAVMECDEGALKQVTSRIAPEVIVVTNLFRDQLDRYGEVMHTRDEILTGIKAAPKSILCLNADCPLTASLALELNKDTRKDNRKENREENRILYYGINEPTGSQEKRELSDARYCMRCGRELIYRSYTYAHLGDYQCPSCGWERPQPDVAAAQILAAGSEYSEIELEAGGERSIARIGLPAEYNIYNALAAVCAGMAAGLSRNSILYALRSVRAPFGRMESFTLGKSRIQMILVKNPAGMGQAIEYVTGTGEPYDVVFCLNDKTADGHDISWIWDTQPEALIRDPNRRNIYVSGIRAEDMQLRLKYAGAREEEITLEKDYVALLDQVSAQASHDQGGRQMSHNQDNAQASHIFVLPNYTSMLELREALLAKTGGSEFWKG